jgi:hypothetical protein
MVGRQLVLDTEDYDLIIDTHALFSDGAAGSWLDSVFGNGTWMDDMWHIGEGL